MILRNHKYCFLLKLIFFGQNIKMNTYDDNEAHVLYSPYSYDFIYNPYTKSFEPKRDIRFAEIHRLQPVRERHNMYKKVGPSLPTNGRDARVYHTRKLHLRAAL
jgi:hypothetical protein